MACPSCCDHCCRSEKVMAAVLEMLPVARELFRSGTPASQMDRICQSEDWRLCVLHAADGTGTTGGGCSAYRWRPIVCRLFGFAAIKNKYGRTEFAACSVLKARSPATTTVVTAAIDLGLTVPTFTAARLMVSLVDPALGNPPLPINRALRLAIDRYGLAVRLAADQKRLTFGSVIA